MTAFGRGPTKTVVIVADVFTGTLWHRRPDVPSEAATPDVP